LDYAKSIELASILEQKGKADAAGKILTDMMDRYPGYWFATSKKLIKLNEHRGLPEENMKIFRQAHASGFFYFIHPGMSEYKPYSDITGFKEVSERDLQLRDSAINLSTTIYEVILPELYDTCTKWPLIFIFHGGGSTIDNAMTHWQAPALNMNYIKVYLQSYRYFDSETFGWGSSDSRLDEEIQDIYKEIDAKYKIDHGKILAGGISAGATAAIDLCLRNVIPATGLIAWCPYIPSFIRNKSYSELKNKHIKIYISAGENDHFRPRQVEMINALHSQGIEFKYIIESARGHEYPGNEELSINEALRFIHSSGFQQD
jgi:predicted esterase